MHVAMLMFLWGTVFATLMAYGAAETPVAGSAPKQPPASASDKSGTEPAADSADAKAANDFAEYQSNLLISLARGTSPRDWALARWLANSPIFANLQKSAGQAVDQLPDAGAAWPDDVLVQWMTLRASRKPAEQDAALRSLKRLESDNAAVWLWVLDRAYASKDQQAIEDALTHMAASRRYNDHRDDFLRMLVDIYQHHPLPPASGIEGLITSLIQNDAPHMLAMTEINLLLSDSYQALTPLCRIDTVSDKNVAHAASCEAIGRILALRGNTVINSRIGFGLLRSSRTFGDQDVRSARDIDWIIQQYRSLQNELSDGTENPLLDIAKITQASTNMRRLVTDQIETGSELEAYRQALVRAGKALKPPGDWVDDQSPFSEARLRADEEIKTRERKAAQAASPNRSAAPIASH